MQPNTEIITQEQGAALTIIVPGAESLPPSLLANIEEGFRDSFAQAEKWRLQALRANTPEKQIAEQLNAELAEISPESIPELPKFHAELVAKAELYEASKSASIKSLGGSNNMWMQPLSSSEQAVYYQIKETAQQRGWPWDAVKAKVRAQLGLTDAFAVPGSHMDKLMQSAGTRRMMGIQVSAEPTMAEEIDGVRYELFEGLTEAVSIMTDIDSGNVVQGSVTKYPSVEMGIRRFNELTDDARKRSQPGVLERAEAAGVKLPAKERAERERLERELAEQKAAEEAKIKAEAAARRKAAAAPDKAKLRNIASIVRAIYLPEVTTEEGAAVLAEITAKIESFAKWIETQTERL